MEGAADASMSRGASVMTLKPTGPQFAPRDLAARLPLAGDTILAGALRPVHRGVGTSDQLDSSVAVLRHRHSDRGGHPEIVVSYGEGLMEGGEYTLRDIHDSVPVGVRAQDDELVTAEPRDGVCGAGGREDAFGNPLEDGVSSVVPEGVVDGFERVAVHEE